MRRGAPGSHPHSDRPNWKPAETFAEYERNVEEGLEQWSWRRVAKLLGVNRMAVERRRLMAELPDDLFERLLKASRRMPSAKALANVALALKGKDRREVECCPHCGGVVRVRPGIGADLAKAVNEWLAEKGGKP